MPACDVWFYISPVAARGARRVIRASVLAAADAADVWVFLDRDHWLSEFTTGFVTYVTSMAIAVSHNKVQLNYMLILTSSVSRHCKCDLLIFANPH